MKKNMRNAGLLLLAAGILVYPSMLLYRTITGRMNSQAEETDDTTKEFAPSYRGRNKKNRHREQHTDHQHA